MKIIIKFFDRLEFICHSIGLAAIFVMMMVITIDSLGRYFFNNPIAGSFELVQNYLMVAVVFLSISYTYKLDGHIKVEIVARLIPDRVRDVLFILTSTLAVVLFSIMTYQGWLKTWEAWINNETIVGVVAWPTFLSYVWIPLGGGLLTVRIIILAAEKLARVFPRPASGLKNKDWRISR